MTIRHVTLNGIPIALQAGSPVHDYSPIGGSMLTRLHGGSAIKTRHWRRTAVVISGSGTMNPGIDGLDYDEVLTLDCTSPMAASSIGLSTSIPIAGTPRPDVAPWGLARTGKDWRRTGCVLESGIALLDPVAGAEQYQVLWLPRFLVFAEPPQHTRDASSGAVGWTLAAEEI